MNQDRPNPEDLVEQAELKEAEQAVIAGIPGARSALFLKDIARARAILNGGARGVETSQQVPARP